MGRGLPRTGAHFVIIFFICNYGTPNLSFIPKIRTQDLPGSSIFFIKRNRKTSFGHKYIVKIVGKVFLLLGLFWPESVLIFKIFLVPKC